MPLLAPHTTADIHSYSLDRKIIRQEIRSTSRLSDSDARYLTFQQRFFVVGGRLLELNEHPVLAIYPSCHEFEVVGWNLRLPYGKQSEIGRELMRKFMTLLAKAERMELNESEEAEWAEISTRVDYRRFCAERTPFHYVEAFFEDRDSKSCRVAWIGGIKERVFGALVNKFELLNPGDRFSSLVKLGKENKLLDITNIEILPPLAENDGEQMWQSWPTNG
jgi:hypothetical protein